MKRKPAQTRGPFLRRIAILADKAAPDRFPFNIAAFRDGLDLELRANVTFFVGENGSGKSTLLEAVATCCGFNARGGGRDHQAQAPRSSTPSPEPCGCRGCQRCPTASS